MIFILLAVTLGKNSVFSVLQNARKLLRCSPNFGELPQKDLCGQRAQVLTPSPCVDLVFEKGTQGLCVWIFQQLLFEQVVLEGSPSSIHALCARQRRQVFLAMLNLTGELFDLVNNFLISNVVLVTDTAPGHVTIAEDTSASFLNVLKNVTLVDLMQVLCRGTTTGVGKATCVLCSPRANPPSAITCTWKLFGIFTFRLFSLRNLFLTFSI